MYTAAEAGGWAKLSRTLLCLNPMRLAKEDISLCYLSALTHSQESKCLVLSQNLSDDNFHYSPYWDGVSDKLQYL